MGRVTFPITAFLLVIAGQNAVAENWPNFLGPRHDGISSETIELIKWPAEGPPKLWQREVGPAFSSFAVVDGRVYTCGQEEKKQVLFCLNAKTGDVLWKKSFEDQFSDPDENVYGTRSTPTVDEGRVYIHGGHGRLLCCDAKDGREHWSRSFANKPHWGYSGSVLIEGKLAIVVAGGKDGSLCAMDKASGEVVWKCGEDAAGYATPCAFTMDAKRYICGFMAESFIIGEAETGRQVLRMPWPSHSGVNVSTPIFHDGHLFVSTGYGFGSGLFKLEPEGDKLVAKEVWKSTKFRNKLQTPILFDGHLYGSDETGLKCVDFMTGEPLWRRKGITHGTMILADGRILLLTEKGGLHLAKVSTEDFKPSATAKLFEGSGYNLLTRKQGARCWTTPVLSDGHLFVRDHTTVICLDLRSNAATKPAL